MGKIMKNGVAYSSGSNGGSNASDIAYDSSNIISAPTVEGTQDNAATAISAANSNLFAWSPLGSSTLVAYDSSDTVSNISISGNKTHNCVEFDIQFDYDRYNRSMEARPLARIQGELAALMHRSSSYHMLPAYFQSEGPDDSFETFGCCGIKDESGFASVSIVLYYDGQQISWNSTDAPLTIRLTGMFIYNPES